MNRGRKRYRANQSVGNYVMNRSARVVDEFELPAETSTLLSAVNDMVVEGSSDNHEDVIDRAHQLQLQADITKGQGVTPAGLRRYYYCLRHIKKIIESVRSGSELNSILVNTETLSVNGSVKIDANIATLPMIIFDHFQKGGFPWDSKLIETILAAACKTAKGTLKVRSSVGSYGSAITWLHKRANKRVTREAEQSQSEFFLGYRKTIGSLLRSGEITSKRRHLLQFEAYVAMCFSILVDILASLHNGPMMLNYTVQLWNSTARGDNINDLLWPNLDTEDDAFIVKPDTVSRFLYIL
jgi:hypothetical protein